MTTGTTKYLSQTFEGAAQLPVGDRRVEGFGLDAGHVAVVRHALVAEGGLGDRAVPPQRGGLARGGGAVRVLGGVGVAGTGARQLQLLLDAVQPRRYQP